MKLVPETREPVPVGDGLSAGEQDAGAFRGSQDYRPSGGVLVHRSLGVHDPGDLHQYGAEDSKSDEQQGERRKTPGGGHDLPPASRGQKSGGI